MGRRAIVIGAICVGAVLLANLVVLAIYLPRLVRSTAPQAPAPLATSAPVVTNASTPNAAPSPAIHTAKPEGAIVQRSQLSPSGNVRINYIRSKGNPMRQIVLESATDGSNESKILFEHQRNAWVVISPNDEWIALNNRPSPGESHLQLYHQKTVGSLQYEPSQEVSSEGQPLENAVWNYYVETMGLPEGTQREAATIDAVGWENDTRLTISVAVVPLDAEDKVPPPWMCTFNVETKEIETSDETVEALKQQETIAGAPTENLATTGAYENPVQAEFPGERFPVTRLRLLDENEVANWPAINVRNAINEVYARHGYDFSDKEDIHRQFARMSWYRPHAGSMADIEKEFSSIEKQNVDLLAKFRPANAPAQRQAKKSRPQRTATPGPGEQIKRAFIRGFTGQDPPP